MITSGFQRALGAIVHWKVLCIAFTLSQVTLWSQEAATDYANIQDPVADDLKAALDYVENDTAKFEILLAIISHYQETNPDSSIAYAHKLIDVLEENLFKQELQIEQIETQSRLRALIFISGLILLSVIGFLLYRNNIQKQKSNEALNKTLNELQSAQEKLIQSEKMASLGELTAGIAHEIQNPLNFVNNFSDLGTELITEAIDEMKGGEVEEAESVLGDLKINLEKISFHGNRASGIVRGMLAHSRSNSVEKEWVDLANLCDEYIRLAYHGMRAKDKTFNASFEIQEQSKLARIYIVPQEIGRVLLNLLNNAFYTVDQKSKLNGVTDFQPLVQLSIDQNEKWVEVKVMDNGLGMSKEVQDKVFQPFFTTKPTGQGTGLGMSISYDIVTKGHGGELLVSSEEGQGSVFTIRLPASYLET